MNTLADLIKRDNIFADWFWTHEVSTGSYTEYEVWDVVFVRDTHEPQLWVTDGDTRRTAYFRGVTGCEADSRRSTGGTRREPDTADTLANLLSDALEIDENPTFREWVEYHDATGTNESAWQQLATYEELTRNRNILRTWLGDNYDEYVMATADYEG